MEPELKRYRGDSENGKSQPNYNISRNEKRMTINLLLFLGDQNNRNYAAIEKIFIPNMISKMKMFNQGKEANLTEFPKLTNDQMDLLHHIFQETQVLHVSNQIEKQKLLSYTKKFKNLLKLIIEIEKQDNFPLDSPNIDITQLEIKLNNRTNNNDTIQQLLIHTPHLRCLKIQGGTLTNKNIMKLESQKLSSIKMINVHVEHENKHLLQQYLNTEKLTNVAIITTNENCPVAQEISNKLPNMFETTNNNIQNLKFTIRQKKTQTFNNLTNLKALKNIVVYYSSQYLTENLRALYEILENSQIQSIKFIEYLDLNRDQLESERYMNLLIQLSEAYASYLRGACPKARIVSYGDHHKNTIQNMLINIDDFII